MKPRLLLFSVVLFLQIHRSNAQDLTLPDIVLTTFNTTMLAPVGIYHCGDDRLFVLEKDESDIEILDTTGAYLGKFLDLTGLTVTGGERGLLGMAFHPNYTSNGFFYLNYTNTAGHTVIARYHVTSNENVADPASATILLTITQPYANHNGGHIAFGPDGYLYIGMGDGGNAGDPQGRGQNPLVLLGKMLRIDVDNGSPYSIPATNPYYQQTDTLPEIWAMGLRNPWKFSFDRLTGDLWIGDVGQTAREEIDFEPAGSPGGSNWGWRCYEGNSVFDGAGCLPIANYDFPAKQHTHTEGYCSITGGHVYRGEKYPALEGLYFFSDYCDGDIMSLYPNGSGGWIEYNLYAAGPGIVAFGTDSKGEMYVVKNTGTIYRLEDSCPFYPGLNGNGAGALITDSGDQYWWYHDDVLIDGANDSLYTPTSPGSYYARVSNGTCTRQTNTLQWMTVSGVSGCTYANALNYNTSAEVDDGSCQFSVNCVCPADLNVDGFITVADLIIFVGVYGTTCFD